MRRRDIAIDREARGGTMKAESVGLVAGMLVLALGACPRALATGPWTFDLETGMVAAGGNDVRIPGDTGTRFSLVDDLSTDARGFLRLRAAYALGPRQRLFALYAPLTLKASGRCDRPVTYEDVTFAAGTPLAAEYTFNSYRLSYGRTVHRSDRLSVEIGLTAKIRDAAIEVRGGDRTARKTNVGFVPLINFAFDWRLGRSVGLRFDGDALAAPQGRAEDVQLAFWYAPRPSIRLRAGYRLLEGGADNDEVYNFALLHYAALGVTVAPW
jgi:hypothetical protein